MTYEIRTAANIEDFVKQSQAEAEGAPDLLSFQLNDNGNAERMILLHGHDVKFCHAFKKWLIWDGTRWAVDDIDQITHLAKKTMVAFVSLAMEKKAGAEVEKFARISLDSRRISGLLSLAECELPVRPTDLDTDPFALNFRNGTLDLRTGILREHRREDLITKLVRYNYSPAAKCPRWLGFLAGAMGARPGASEADLERSRRLVAYLQRAMGYSLTGRTSEKAVFIPFGTGDNGKSTMLDTLRHLIEEYSVLLQVDTLMVRQESNNSQADLADLRGARFAQTSETEDGQRLGQGKLKRITQGMGKIKATRKYENPIEFAETHKLWIDTNRKPTITDVDDDATFNRLHPIPFTVTIAKAEIDRDLPQKLLEEAEGILAWVVAGAQIWHAEGLGKLAEIETAKEEWREDMDQLGRFIKEWCVLGEAFQATASSLYSEYKLWSSNCGERLVLTATAFGKKLTDRGFEKKHKDYGALYLGIGLRAINDGGRAER